MHSQQRKRSSLKHPFSLILILLCLCDWPGMPLLIVLARCSLIFTMMALRGQLHMHASRTLTPSEQNYTQLEKEALSLVFGIKKFHPYIYGREFPITSHSPPFWDPRQVSLASLAAARLQRWALLLSSYKYQIQYKATQTHSNADGLSRLQSKQTNHSTLSLCLLFSIFTRLGHCW